MFTNVSLTANETAQMIILEHNAVFTHNYHGVWIGGYNTVGSMDFIWEHSDAVVVSQHWYTNQPNTRAPNEPYMETLRNHGTWNDYSGEHLQPFICEFDD